jgi:hypothetical protein
VLFETGNNDKIITDPTYWGPLATALTPGRSPDVAIDVQLDKVGVKPSDINYVILGHMHLDHAGNVGKFPSAPATRFREDDMNQTTRRVFGVAGFALLLATSASFAQQPAPVRVRGTVEAVDGPLLTVKSRDGQTTYKVKLTDNAAVRGIVKAPLSDIKDNSFIGVTGMPQSDGSQKAVEIHIFPEPMRGTGEGHRPWDLLPNSTMTNATVAQSVKGVDGNEITLKYKEGEKKIVVVPETVIVTYVPGDKSELKPGAKIFIGAANKKEDGTLEASAVSVGRDGLTPPM